LSVLESHIITTETAEMWVCSSFCNTVDVRASWEMGNTQYYHSLPKIMIIMIMVMTWWCDDAFSINHIQSLSEESEAFV